MKKLPAIILLAIAAHTSPAQTIRLKTFDKPPEIGYKREQFTLWFSVADVQMAYKMMDVQTQKKYDISKLKTGEKVVVLKNGNPVIQQLIDEEIGAFLLLGGRASVETKDHVKIPELLEDEGPPVIEMNANKITPYIFSDPKSGKEIFMGRITEPK